jgi:hypothetical protein
VRTDTCTEELFRAKVINLLVEQKLLPPERVQVLYSWKHSGFNVHAGEQVAPEAKADLEDLAQYILRNPFSVKKMTLEWPADMVIYRSRLNPKINRNFEVFTATDFLAAITQHIPDKGAQMVRYYGWYSNKMRGVRHRGLPPELVPHRPGLSPPPPLKLPSKRWRDLILRVWHVDPLRCPSHFNSSFIIHHSSFPPPPGLRECANRLRTTLFQGGLEPGFCLAPAFSCPARRRTAPLFAHCLAVAPLPPANAIGANPKPSENRQNFPVDALGPVWQHGSAMNESENQFSFSRAASSTSGRAKNQIPISILPGATSQAARALCRRCAPRCPRNHY